MPFRKGHKTNIGRPCSEETKKKIGLANSVSLIGNIPWNKGVKIQTNSGRTHFIKGHVSWSVGTKGVVEPNSGSFKKGERRSPKTEFKKGQIISEEIRKKMSEVRMGEKCHFWKGGVSQTNRTERENIMSSFEYKEWRRKVFERDDYRCIDCGQRGVKLHADHIYPFSLFPRIRTDINNGETRCVECHIKTDTYGIKAQKKYVEIF
jgi:5-methylcytosine-specific restriction endonuclease McrA